MQVFVYFAMECKGVIFLIKIFIY